MKCAVRFLIAGLLLLLSLQLMGENRSPSEEIPLSFGVKKPYSDIPVITRMSEYYLSYEVKEAPQIVEFRPVDGKGDVVLKDIGKSTVIFGPESFESTTFPPSGWSQYSFYPYSSYHWYRKENNGHDGSYVAWIDCDPNAYYNGQEELLQTPQLDFSQCEGCTLFFFLRQGSYTADVLYIGISTNGGAPSGTWTVLTALSQTGSSWGGYYLSLSPDFDGDSSVVIGFDYEVYPYSSGGGVGLDYILVTAGSGGGQPNLKPYTPAGWSGPLVISTGPDSISEDTLSAGEPYYLSFALINDGTADVSDSFSVYITANDNIWGYLRLPGLQQGYTFGIKNICDTIDVSGTYTWRLVVDSLNEIAESDEEDNVWSRDFYWMSAGIPDIWVSPESLYYYYETTGKISRVDGYWNEREVSVRVDIPDFGVETLKDGTQKIIIPEFGHLSMGGVPYLPAKTFTLAIPPGAVVTSVNVDGVFSPLPGIYNITPAQPLLPGSNPKTAERIMEKYRETKERIYSSNAFYPDVMGRLSGTGGLRKYNLVDVDVCPFSYNPVTGKLQFAGQVTITIHYNLSSEKLEEAERLKSDNLIEEEARDAIYNYKMAREWYKNDKSVKSLYDYVIITTPSCSSSVSSLVDWKQSLGYNVKIVTKEWINSSYNGNDIQQKIRNFLRDKYPQGEWGIEYVLIVGDDNNIPMRRCVPWNNDFDSPWDDSLLSPVPTDLYYAELTDPDNTSWNSDGDDYYGEVGTESGGSGNDSPDYHADVHLGRIPWSDNTKIQHICQKIVAFEQNTDITYKKSSLLAGAMYNYYNENGEGMARCDGAELMEKLMNDEIIDRGYAVTEYEKEGVNPCPYSCTYPITRTNIINQWQAKGIFNEVAHGWLDSFARKVWVEDTNGDNIPQDNEIAWYAGLTSNDAPSLDDTYPAIGFLCSCLCSYPEFLNNLGAALLYQGAAGIVSGTRETIYRPGWSGPSDGGSMSFDYYFFKKLLKDTTNTHAIVGNALDAARNVYAGINVWYLPDRYVNIYGLMLYGDPSLYHFGYGGDNYLYNTMQVHNSGDGTLIVSGISSKKSLVAFISPSSFTVSPGGYQEVSVGINPQGLSFGTHYDTLLIVSNDPDESPYPERVVLSVILTGIEEEEDNYQLTISNYQFLRAYPNPFSNKTVISYRSPVISENPELITDYQSPITLKIYDLSGRLIRTFNLCNQNKSVKSVSWDGRDTDGKPVPSGIYFVKVNAGDNPLTGKLILIR